MVINVKSKITLSHAEMILLALYRVAAGTTQRVPFESIVLEAWKDFPDEFSLNNHPEYPDSYTVSKRLYSDLITKRLVISLRKQIYRLTDKGLALAQELERNVKNQNVESKISLSHLNRDEKEFIDNALKSRAFRTWKEGRGGNLIDYDVRVFLQFSTGTPVRERRRKLDNAKEAIGKATESGMSEAVSLQSLIDYIISRFPTLFEEV